jgi:SAM-dependent methyltransferase
MKSADELRNIVKKSYGEIARAGGSCCGPGGCGDTPGGVGFAEDYRGLAGYLPAADLGLGCGIPTEYAGLAEGQTVVDLGSGAGNDAFVARAVVGDGGRVVGLDMVPEMVARAEANAAGLGFENVEFRLGEIEDMPLPDGLADVVVSNCVLNLVPDKDRAFAEIHRILKPGGHFCVSDIVLEGELPSALAASEEAYAGCVSGAIPRDAYLATIGAAGFVDVTIRSTRRVWLPATVDVDGRAPTAEATGFGLYSITVVGYKAS